MKHIFKIKEMQGIKKYDKEINNTNISINDIQLLNNLKYNNEILDKFNIDKEKLDTFNNREKLNYLKICLEKKLKYDINSSLNKYKNLKKNYLAIDKLYLKKFKNKNNLMNWLNINTKFEYLKDDLKKKIIINLPDNKDTNIDLKNFIYNLKEDQKLFNNINYLQKEKWTKTDENEFQNLKKNNKKKFINNIKSSNFNQMTIYPFINKLKNFSNNLDFRNFLLDKFMDGEWITKNELRYLTLTSDLTFKLLDKNYYQKNINNLNQEFIDEIEFYIANDIVNSYKVVNDYLKNLRNIYIKNQLKNKKNLNKIYNNFQEKCENLYKKSEIKKFLKHDYIKLSKLNNKNNNIRLYPDNKVKNSTLFGKINKDDLKNINNPQTRLVKKLKKDNDYFLLNKKLDQDLNFVISNKYKKKDENNIVYNEKNFKRIFTNGPKSLNKPMIDKKNISEINNKAAIIIQSFIRKIISRLKYKYLKNIKNSSSKVINNFTTNKKRKGIISPGNLLSIKKSVKYKEYNEKSIIKTSNIYKRNTIKIFSAKNNNLFIKHFTLLNVCKTNKYNRLVNSGYEYSKEDINVVDESLNTPLFYSCVNGSLLISQYLVERKANINIKCENGNTPLHMAFKNGNLELIVYLIKNNGNLNFINNFGFTPISYGRPDVLKKLDMNNCIAYLNKNDESHINSITQLSDEYDNHIQWKKIYNDDETPDYVKLKFKKIEKIIDLEDDTPLVFSN